jgi:hypothetical protein
MPDLKEKIKQKEQELQICIAEYNDLGKKREIVKNQTYEIQGALSILQELDGDQTADTKST